MPTIDIAVESPLSQSVRAAQVSAMFDVPAQDRARLTWQGNLPIEDRPWQIGLITGPSGSGKSTILNQIFGRPAEFTWDAASVIDDFGRAHSVEDVAAICQAVGFNTIPAWLRPHAVLSNGEKFRVDLARRMLEGGGKLISCDEFTSVVDRQVAKIGAHAVQKHIRTTGKQFVAATCHYDLEEWLQPDWILEPATMTFRWRAVQRRPAVECSIAYVKHGAWAQFAPFHYLSATLHPSARCFVLFVDGQPAAFTAALHRPHQTVRNIIALPRGVVLPDYQGLGLIFALIDRIGAVYMRRGYRVRSYPAHPGYIRAHDRSRNWQMISPPGLRSSNVNSRNTALPNRVGGRPCAVFEFCGEMASEEAAALLLDGDEFGGTTWGVRI
jgi:ABC-type lipoprotein export system ATPase subunit